MNNYTGKDIAAALWLLAIAAYGVWGLGQLVQTAFPLTEWFVAWGAFAVGVLGVIGLGVYAYEVIEKPVRLWRERMLVGWFAGALSLAFLVTLVA